MRLKFYFPQDYDVESITYDPATQQLTIEPLFLSPKAKPTILTVRVELEGAEGTDLRQRTYALKVSGTNGALGIVARPEKSKPFVEQTQ